MANGKFQNFMNRMFDPGPNVTEQSIQQNRAMADALMAQGPGTIQHPLQGLAHLANALNAQAYRQKAQRGQQALQKQRAQQMGDLLNNLSLDPQGRQLLESLSPDMQREVASTLAVSQLMPQDSEKPRFDEFDVIGQDGSRTTVEGRITQRSAEVLTPAGQFLPLAQVFPNAQRIEPAVTRGVQTDDPTAFAGTPTQRGKRQIELNDQVAAVNAFGSQAERLLETIEETEGANTVVAALANVGNRIRQEVMTLSDQFGVEFEAGMDAFNPDRYEGVFSAHGLAGANPRVKNGFLGLAIQRAMAAGLGTGRALSDTDIAQQLDTLAANQSDPQIIRAVFADSFRNLSDQVRFSAEANTLQLPTVHEPGFLNPVDPIEQRARQTEGFDQLSPQQQQRLIELMRQRSGNAR